MVECDLAKVEVAGSNPVSRSNIFRRLQPFRISPSYTLTHTEEFDRAVPDRDELVALCMAEQHAEDISNALFGWILQRFAQGQEAASG